MIAWTAGGAPLPPNYRLARDDRFGLNGTVRTFADLHARYNEGEWWGVDANGLVTIPNTVVNNEQQTYVHFEQAIELAPYFMTIQARGQPDSSITSAKLVSKLTAKTFVIEAKVRTPGILGSWAAFWLAQSANAGSQSEIDVEWFMQVTPGLTDTAVGLYNHPSSGDLTIAHPWFTSPFMTFWGNVYWSKAWHTFTIAYDDTAHQIQRYIDGALIYTAANWQWTGADPATALNLAVGGTPIGTVADPALFSADFDVEYVKWYLPV